MRIGIDARFFGPKEKGLGIYVQKLVENLEETSGNEDHEFFVFLQKERFDDFQPKNKNFKKVTANFRWYSWQEQLFFPFFLNKYELDLMHFCHFNVPIFYRRRFVVTIHDLILFHFPTFRNSTLNKFYYLFKLLMHRLVITSAAHRAEKVIAISKFTKNDLVETLKIPEKQIEVVYQGCNFTVNKNKKNSDDILKKYAIIKPYFLYVGNAYPHKNLERLSEVFLKVNQKYSSVNLVLAGGKDYFYKRLEREVQKNFPVQKNKIIFPGFIDDLDLPIVFQEAEVVVFPSLYEGFGFPPLEALAYRKKVACSNQTSMPEILGQTVEYFNPKDNNSIFNCLNKVYLAKGELSEKEIEKKIKKFDWSKTAQNTLNIYESTAKIK